MPMQNKKEPTPEFNPQITAPNIKQGLDIVLQISNYYKERIDNLEQRVYNLEVAEGLLEVSGIKPRSIPVTITDEIIEQEAETTDKKQIAEPEHRPVDQPPPKTKPKIKLNKWAYIIIIGLIILIYFWFANSQGWSCIF